jgi:NAD(P)-dependent dehydrogenase (short-subunit alcohol dehydrogenase family)
MADQPALAGKTAIITGGSGGIAGGIARYLLADGAALLLMARGREALDQRQAELVEAFPGARVEVFTGDACEAADVRAALQAAYDLDGHLDIVVALAGGGIGFRPLLMLDEAEFRYCLESNAVSTFMAIRYGAPLMRRGGAIVCISSNAARIIFPWFGPYSIAKATVESLVRSAAEELGGAGIRVNAVRPGLIPVSGTADLFANEGIIRKFQEQMPLLRPGIPCGAPDDIGAAVRFLVGPESTWITGESIGVDGGNTLRKAPDLGELVDDQEAFSAAKRGQVLPEPSP